MISKSILSISLILYFFSCSEVCAADELSELKTKFAIMQNNLSEQKSQLERMKEKVKEQTAQMNAMQEKIERLEAKKETSLKVPEEPSKGLVFKPNASHTSSTKSPHPHNNWRNTSSLGAPLGRLAVNKRG